MSIWKKIVTRLGGTKVKEHISFTDEGKDRTDTYYFVNGQDGHGHVATVDGETVYSRTPTGRVITDDRRGVKGGKVTTPKPDFQRATNSHGGGSWGGSSSSSESSSSSSNNTGGGGCCGCPYR